MVKKTNQLDKNTKQMSLPIDDFHYEGEEDDFQNKTEEEYPILSTNIQFEKQERSIFELHRRYQRGEINLNPDYQRRSIWKTSTKSKLIESVLLKVPIQVIYFSESTTDENISYEVVDGQQRLTAFFDFLDNKFKLEKLTVLKDYNGKLFNDLDDKVKRKLEDYILITYVITKDSSEEAKFDIFERINIGSTNLNAQEIRNCIFRGEKIDLLRKLAKNTDFSILVKQKDLQKRMKDEELVLRFLSFYLKGADSYKGNITSFLNETLQNYDKYQSKLKDIESIFTQSMKTIKKILGNEAFVFNPKSSMINFSLFDVLSVSFAQNDKAFLEKHKDKIKQSFELLKKNNTEFIMSLTSSTLTQNNVQKRFDIWFDTLDEIVKG